MCNIRNCQIWVEDVDEEVEEKQEEERRRQGGSVTFAPISIQGKHSIVVRIRLFKCFCQLNELFKVYSIRIPLFL